MYTDLKALWLAAGSCVFTFVITSGVMSQIRKRKFYEAERKRNQGERDG
jgi:hypothetical protein